MKFTGYIAYIGGQCYFNLMISCMHENTIGLLVGKKFSKISESTTIQEHKDLNEKNFLLEGKNYGTNLK